MSTQRGRQMIREWTIVRALSDRRGHTVCELADLVGARARTIYRDLELLQSAGFPLVDERIDGEKRWRMLNWRSEVAG